MWKSASQSNNALLDKSTKQITHNQNQYLPVRRLGKE